MLSYNNLVQLTFIKNQIIVLTNIWEMEWNITKRTFCNNHRNARQTKIIVKIYINVWNVRNVLEFIMFEFIGIIKSIVKLIIPMKYQMKDISGEIALIIGAIGDLRRALVTIIYTFRVICANNYELARYYTFFIKINRKFPANGHIINILINNAGLINIGIFWKTPNNLLSHVMEVNIIF
ncbi:estradiol 17-beta-dehydrogenase 11-like isoform X1 [Vespula maculifrons]|uniref:Estradiol 17-beta-dehydrogenase 11-like isoform X1 n=1 Tax=Vespula maculifrons TaxID=7453 RepID=A0ABD2BZG5_VESMC